jgi:epoxide hydrolase-like predicted phosphatase
LGARGAGLPLIEGRISVDRSFDVVLFDFGGVFTASPFAAVSRYSTELGLAPERLTELVFGSYHDDSDHPWHRLERGEISLEEARGQILEGGRSQGVEVDIYQVFAAMADDMQENSGVNQQLVEYVAELSAAQYTLGIITNNLKEFSDGWRALIPVEELFDFVVDSSEVGMRKPDPAIYRHALSAAGLEQPQRAVFIDDYKGNVDAATALGIKGVHVDGDQHKTIRDLRQILGV